MALIHRLVVSRPSETDSWICRVYITDETTGRIFHHEFNPPAEPSESQLDVLIAAAKLGDQAELDYNANPMNLTRDEEMALGYLRDIKREVILEIRSHPDVTLTQMQASVDANHPGSIINFTKLYQFYLNLLNLSTWDDFKLWVIKKYRLEGIVIKNYKKQIMAKVVDPYFDRAIDTLGHYLRRPYVRNRLKVG